MTISIVLQVLWSSVAMSTFYVLFSVAFSLYLKVTTYWNFAQAGFIAVAFVAFYIFNRVLGFPVPITLIIVVVVLVILGAVIERYGFDVLRRRSAPHLTYFIFTFMLAEFIIFATTLALGTEPRSLASTLFEPSRQIGGVFVTNWDLRALAVTGALLAVLWVFLTFSRQGQMITAVADNAGLAELYRIDARKIYMMTMAIAAVFITIGTWLFGTRATFIPISALDLLTIAVIATILGGVGSVFGAAVAAVFIGVLKGFSIFVIPSIWQNTMVYYLLFIVIVIFPGGIAHTIRSHVKLRLFRSEPPSDAAQTAPAMAAMPKTSKD